MEIVKSNRSLGAEIRNIHLEKDLTKQELDFITEGLSFRALVAVKSYSATENQRSFNPFYYGIAESETELGLVNRIYQIQEGTEFNLQDCTL